jgi:hypothetical protein
MKIGTALAVTTDLVCFEDPLAIFVKAHAASNYKTRQLKIKGREKPEE